MVRIGLVGVGFMGMIHYLASLKTAGCQVTALCSRDPKKRAGDWRGIQGNFGPPGTQMDLSAVRAYAALDDLLADPAVDLVDVCLPSDKHAAVAEAALAAGKHVLVEKPIALSLAEADRMVAAAKKANRLLMVAHVLPFFPDFAVVADAARTGRYGKLRAAQFRRHISPPDWSDAFSDADRTGGPIIDLHVHDTHFIAMLAGLPKAVHSTGLMSGERVDYVATNYLYDGGPAIAAASGACSQKGRPFTHGYEVYFEQATLHYEAGGPLTVYTASGAERPELPSADPVDCFAAELAAAVAAVNSGTDSPVLGGKLARDALALCLAERESVRTGAVVAVA
ncbi:MAG TPA: Gfo/Idh/MocA family oxidoreductase [Planctomycetia bacterium]|nr:Gfo/Idh/MocA family oxidoreductase [Planctomycetia bacterium]